MCIYINSSKVPLSQPHESICIGIGAVVLCAGNDLESQNAAFKMSHRYTQREQQTHVEGKSPGSSTRDGSIDYAHQIGSLTNPLIPTHNPRGHGCPHHRGHHSHRHLIIITRLTTLRRTANRECKLLRPVYSISMSLYFIFTLSSALAHVAGSHGRSQLPLHVQRGRNHRGRSGDGKSNGNFFGDNHMRLDRSTPRLALDLFKGPVLRRRHVPIHPCHARNPGQFCSRRKPQS